MAWTKTKIAALTGATILLATIATVSLEHHWQHTPPRQRGRMTLPTGSVTPMVSYHNRHVLILAGDGSLWTWGENLLGWPVLGLANTNIQKTTSLQRIGTDTDWEGISAGLYHCVAIKSDGTLWAWGGNFNHMLGDGTKTTRLTPVPSVPGNDWKQAVASETGTVALKNDGTLWAWGGNASGSLGLDGTKETAEARQVGMSSNWTKVWASGIQTVGLQADGGLWFWGSLDGGAIKTNKFLVPTRLSPDTNWMDVCFGYFTVFAIKSDGTLWSWGKEANFYTGATDPNAMRTPRQVSTENDWQACASAGGFYHLLRKQDGSLWALNAAEHQRVKPNSEYQPIKLQKINFDKDIAAFAAGGDDMGVVLTPAGEVWTWGKVIGEHAAKDYFGPKGKDLSPTIKFIDHPWQVSNRE